MLQLEKDLLQQELGSKRTLLASSEAALAESKANHSLEMCAAQEGWSESERVWKDALQEKQLKLQASEAEVQKSALMLVADKVKLDAASDQLKLSQSRGAALVESRVHQLEGELAAAKAAYKSADSGVSVWRQAFEEAEEKHHAACSSLEATRTNLDVEKRLREFDSSAHLRVKEALDSQQLPAEAAAALKIQLQLLQKEQQIVGDQMRQKLQRTEAELARNASELNAERQRNSKLELSLSQLQVS